MRYGPCDLNVPKPSVIKLLIHEVLNPFYIFQIFAVAFWIWDHYVFYGSCIAIVTTASVLVTLFETLKNNKDIRRMARYSCEVQRLIGGR